MSYQSWRDQAACNGADTRLFYPEDGGSVRKAMAFCAVCPVVAECRQWALEFPEVWGVWGGTSERDRRQPRAAGVSRFRGVTWHQKLGKWTARATVNGSRVHVGVFVIEEDAGRAVLKAEGASPELAASLVPQSTEVAA